MTEIEEQLAMEKGKIHDTATDYPTPSDFDRTGLIMVRVESTGWWECHGKSLLQAKKQNTWVKVANIYPAWTHTPDWVPNTALTDSEAITAGCIAQTMEEQS